MLKHNWGEILKKQREKTGLTQEDIAKVLNRTRNHVHNMETQKRPPKAHELAIFADTIGLDMSLLFDQNYSFSARLLQIAQLDKNMTIGDLEKVTGIDYFKLSQAENGQITLEPNEIETILNVLFDDKSILDGWRKASINQILSLTRELGLSDSDILILKNFLNDRLSNS